MCGEHWFCPCGIYHAIMRTLCGDCRGSCAPDVMAQAHGDVPRLPVLDPVEFNSRLHSYSAPAERGQSCGVALRSAAAGMRIIPSGIAGGRDQVRA